MKDETELNENDFNQDLGIDIIDPEKGKLKGEKTEGELSEEKKAPDKKLFFKNWSGWAVISGVLFVLLMISLFTQGFGITGKSTAVISEKEAEEKVISFINNYLLRPPYQASLKGFEELDNLYKLEIDVGGQIINSYLTTDGKLFFPQGIDLSTTPALPQTKPKEIDTSQDPYLGPADAKVTVIEFSDFQCPYCAAAAGTHSALISQLKSKDPQWEAPVPKLKELAKEGKIKFVFKQFPLGFHPHAEKAAEASECAFEQGKFWEYHDILFNNQNNLELESLKKYAQELNLDATKFNECLDSGKHAQAIEGDINQGQAAGISGTPAFLVNGQLVSGAVSFSVLKAMIEAELGNKETKEAEKSTKEEIFPVKNIGEKTIKLTSIKFTFSPALINVNKGDKVKLIISKSPDFLASEIPQGLTIKEFNINQDFLNQETEIVFEADKSGDFDLLCNQACGAKEGQVIGKLVVN